MELERLHRLIVTSTAYRQSSATSAKGMRIDPENHLYWRKPVQRLDAEAIRDALLSVSGSLNRKMYFRPPCRCVPTFMDKSWWRGQDGRRQ